MSAAVGAKALDARERRASGNPLLLREMQQPFHRLLVFDPAILFREKTDLVAFHVILLNQGTDEPHGTDAAERHDDTADNVGRDRRDCPYPASLQDGGHHFG